MNVGAPILDVVPGARGQVLLALCQSMRGASGREIARRAGLPASTTSGVLADLVESGIVLHELLANSYGYQLNSKHVLADAIIDMAAAHVILAKKIKEYVSEWAIQPTAGWLYGSTARGDGDRQSDVDLFFVWPASGFDDDAWDEQVGALILQVNQLTGNYVQVAQHGIDTFLGLERDQSSFTANLRVEGIDLVDSSWRRISQTRQTAPQA